MTPLLRSTYRIAQIALSASLTVLLAPQVHAQGEYAIAKNSTNSFAGNCLSTDVEFGIGAYAPCTSAVHGTTMSSDGYNLPYVAGPFGNPLISGGDVALTSSRNSPLTYDEFGIGGSSDVLHVQSSTPVSTLLFHEIIGGSPYISTATSYAALTGFGSLTGSDNGTNFNTDFFRFFVSTDTSYQTFQNFTPDAIDPFGTIYGTFSATLDNSFTGNYYFASNAGVSLHVVQPSAGDLFSGNLFMLLDNVSALDANGNPINNATFTLDGQPFNPLTTPEPSSLALLGSGLVGLVPMIRRHRRAMTP